MEPYLRNVDSYLLDEKRVVTYKWLSKTLKIHSSLAKEILNQYVKDPSRRIKCSVTYLLVGKVKDGVSVCIKKDIEVNEAKKSYDSVIGEHVYSIQPVETVDIQSLYIADKLAGITIQDSQLKSIQYDGENKKLEPTAELKPESSTAVIRNELKVGTSSKLTEDKKKEALKETPAIVTKKPVESKKDIKAKANVKQQDNGKKGGAIFAMWDKQKQQIKQKPKQVVKEHDKQQNNRSVPSDEKLMNLDYKTVHKEPVKDSKDQKSSKNTRHVNNQKRKNKTNASENQPKKMKRIILFSDSESENDEDVEEEARDTEEEPKQSGIDEQNSDDIFEEQETIKEPLVEQNRSEHHRRKRRKVISKMEVGEDNYLYTKKEVVYESCSESEEEGPVKREQEQVAMQTAKETNVKLKQDVQQKKKQASITNFFTKVPTK